MMAKMKTMLFMAQKATLDGKSGGSFGAFGWSGEAPKLILEIMKNRFAMSIIEMPLHIKYVPDSAGLDKCREFGKRIAEKTRDKE